MHSPWSPTPRLFRVPLFGAAVLCAALLFLLPLARAQAAFQLCRTDPIVTLSNGDVVSIYVEIATEPSDIERIDYKLHVAKGVTATSIVYLGAELGLVENLVVVQDGKPDEYKSETTVRGIAKSVGVTATTIFEDESVTVIGAGAKTLKATIDIQE